MIVPEVVNLIVLGAATLLVLIFFIKEIIKTFRRRPTTKPIAVGLVILGFIFLVGLVCNIHEMEWADLAQMLLMIGLIAVTLSYASSAARQSEASVEMAEETKKQRYSESLPLLVPTIPPILKTDKLPYESVQSGIGMKVLWGNVGKGVAINSRVSFESAPTSTGKANSFPPRELGTVKVGGKKEVDYSEILDDGQLHDISDAYQPRLEAEYRDTYERNISTVQKIRIDKQNGEFSLGELYFTVNGRRLGEEVIKHD